MITNAPYSAFYYLFYTSLKERLQQVRKHAGYLLALRLTRMQIFDPSSSRWQFWLSLPFLLQQAQTLQMSENERSPLFGLSNLGIPMSCFLL